MSDNETKLPLRPQRSKGHVNVDKYKQILSNMLEIKVWCTFLIQGNKLKQSKLAMTVIVGYTVLNILMILKSQTYYLSFYLSMVKMHKIHISNP